MRERLRNRDAYCKCIDFNEPDTILDTRTETESERERGIIKPHPLISCLRRTAFFCIKRHKKDVDVEERPWVDE